MPGTRLSQILDQREFVKPGRLPKKGNHNHTRYVEVLAACCLNEATGGTSSRSSGPPDDLGR